MSKLDLLMGIEINGTMAWLSSKSQTEQDTVIAFSIRQAQRAKLLCKQHKAHIANIQQKHHVQKNQKKDARFRRKVEKKFKLIFEGETHLYYEFPDLTRDQANTITKALSNPCTINDLYFAHMWFINVMYNGHIFSVKTSEKYKIPKVTATYWKDDETAEEGEHVNMTLWALLVDLVTALRETISYADLHIPRIFFDTYHHMNHMQFSI